MQPSDNEMQGLKTLGTMEKMVPGVFYGILLLSRVR